MADKIFGSNGWDRVYLGSGSQIFDAGAGNDHIISLADAGEPDPAQTNGAGRVTPTQTEPSDDVLIGGLGADKFEFRALLNAKDSVIAQHTNAAGHVNWKAVAGENDNVHDHYVAGWGTDCIADFNRAEGDSIVIRGHTVEVAAITRETDKDGVAYTLIKVISQQGDGGAGGANTETGAHDEDIVGFIKVYGDEVTADDIDVQAAGVFDGIDMLERADEAYGDADAGATQVVYSNTDGHEYNGILAVQTDKVHAGLGAQTINTGGGNDFIYSYSDAGEPDPAQTVGDAGRVTDPVSASLANDEFWGGQGRDTFAFRLLLNAKQEILDKHTRSDGSINWRRVAGENDNVHDHYVEGIGKDIIWDFSNQDGDRIDIRGHTVEIAEIEYGLDEHGDFSLIMLRSQQGNGGAAGANTLTGAHDEDPLGCIKVYGDKVTLDDITLKANVFYGVDQLDEIAAGEVEAPANNPDQAAAQLQQAIESAEKAVSTYTGTSKGDRIVTGSGKQIVEAGDGNDHILSYGDGGEPDPAQTENGEGRVYDPVPEGCADDEFSGGAGRDTFEFRALLNAREEVLEQHTNISGRVNWRAVAGENDNVHDHFVVGWGNDCIRDFESGVDKIVIRGHTVEIASMTRETDANGVAYTLIKVISQQGNGGAGGANTQTGAHDEDFVGTIKVFGDEVKESDITVKAAGIFDGIDQLYQADTLADYNGGVQSFESTVAETIQTAPDSVKTVDYVTAGAGVQEINTGAGRDLITLYSDAGEPDPAQTDGEEGRITERIDPATANDIVSGGQDRDTFLFNFLLNATDVVLARHTRDDGSVNWRRVAGENDVVHDHYVMAGGDDCIRDFSNQDGDRIILRGHTVEIAKIEYDVDEVGDYSLIYVRSQQGNGGAGGASTETGAHDEDPLGTIKVYGDKVTVDDIKVQAAGVFDGVDKYTDESASASVGNLIVGTSGGETLLGTDTADNIHARGGSDTVTAGDGNDLVFGEGGNDILLGGADNDWLEGGWGRDAMFGEAGEDTLFADLGRDSLFGGSEADTFVLGSRLQGASINDWEDGLDRIDFTRNAAVKTIDDLAITQITANEVEIVYENVDEKVVEITVTGADPFDLSAFDFHF